MQKYHTRSELTESKAQTMHQSNLNNGGVFDESGNRSSDIDIERAYAESFLHYCPPGHERIHKVPESGWYIYGIGYGAK